MAPPGFNCRLAPLRPWAQGNSRTQPAHWLSCPCATIGWETACENCCLPSTQAKRQKPGQILSTASVDRIGLPCRIVATTECSSAWLERCVRDAEVVGSNPITPTCSDVLRHNNSSNRWLDQCGISWNAKAHHCGTDCGIIPRLAHQLRTRWGHNEQTTVFGVLRQAAKSARRRCQGRS